MNRHLLYQFVIIALLAGLAGSALGEVKTEYTTQGNNVGAIIGTGYGGPFWGQTQFPRGSGNFFGTHDDSKWNKDSDDTRINWGVNIARDLNGDGVSDDTLFNQHRGAHIYGCNSSLESYSLLEGLYNAGNNMFEAASRAEVNRVYSSLDAEDMAAWPAEFREGRSANGDPILIGAETVCIRFGDAFHEIGDAMGVSMEYRFHMLNFGESNNMVYGHVFIRNMSEYNKWNPLKKYAERMQNTPEGQVWKGWQYHFALTRMRIGARDEGWIIHCPYNILGQVDRSNSETSFAGGIPAMFAQMTLRAPSFNGETMELTNANAMAWNSEYGFGDAPDVLATGNNAGDTYRYGLGRKAGELSYKSNLQGFISPWTGQQAWGYPGVIEPGDARYEKWMWGDRQSENTYMFWSELHDFAPRDTASADFVIMFVMPPSGTWAMPRATLANLDDQGVQDHLAPVLDNANVAKLVYEGGLILPETPAPPELTIIPGDRQVSLTWSDINFQTPDRYYYFLKAHPELDPHNYYKEFDMEGYRLYRSFVGPSDTHSEMIFSCSKAENNISFCYLDSYEKDQPLYRMWNGKKVWYALVPFDKNYDTVTGQEYSLPEPSSGKVWNRPGQNLYTVIPRSNASDFQAAGIAEEGITFQPAESGTTVTPGRSAQLAGDGAGHLLVEPVYMAPGIKSLSFDPINSERITQDRTVTLLCDGVDWYYGGCNRTSGISTLKVVEGSKEGLQAGPLKAAGANEQSLYINGPVDEDGVCYAIDVTFENLNKNRSWLGLYHDIKLGGYSGAAVAPLQGGCGGRSVGGDPGAGALVRTGIYTITWKDAGDGKLTVEVREKLHNRDVPYTQYFDDENGAGWGFWTDPAGGYATGYFNYFMNRIPRTQRTVTQDQYLDANRTADFCLYINGLPWLVSDLTSMPLPGTVWTVTNCYGTWNDEKTSFTQVPDMPWIGDSWKLEIKAMSQKAEDADLSLINVVPNPYLASSILDLSPDSRRIEFVNLPDQCTIRIYTLSGNMVNVLNHIGANRHGWGNYADLDRLDANNQPRELSGYDNHGGSEPWNLRNRFGQTIASGLYFYVVTDSRGKKFTGKFYVII